MFRVNRAAENTGVVWASVILLIVMVAATGATVWLVAEIQKEQRVVREILEGGPTQNWAEDIERLGTLPGELHWQLVFTILVLLVLILAGGGLVLVVRAYLKSLASLREVTSLALDILASMDQGVITTDREGNVTSMNPKVQDLLGMNADCVGRPIAGVFPGSRPLADVSQEVLKSGESQYDRDFSIMRNGHQVRLRTECHLLRGADDVIGAVLHIRDVTERILIEERMRRMERFLGLGTLAAGLHHEIKNPLSALSLHVQLLEERLQGQADAETMENLGVLKTEVTRIAGVLESFRDYADPLHTSKGSRLNSAETDIAVLVRRTVELIRPTARAAGVRVNVSVSSAGGGSPTAVAISADATRLEQVLLNLVMNALDEMPEGGELSLSVCRGDGKITIEVSDTGRGIPNNIRARIFDPYFTTKRDGCGMGLAVCDKIIRQHGGQIDVDTGSWGATFRILLPMDDPQKKYDG